MISVSSLTQVTLGCGLHLLPNHVWHGIACGGCADWVVGVQTGKPPPLVACLKNHTSLRASECAPVPVPQHSTAPVVSISLPYRRFLGPTPPATLLYSTSGAGIQQDSSGPGGLLSRGGGEIRGPGPKGIGPGPWPWFSGRQRFPCRHLDPDATRWRQGGRSRCHRYRWSRSRRRSGWCDCRCRWSSPGRGPD